MSAKANGVRVCDPDQEQRIRQSERVRQEAVYGAMLLKATDQVGALLACLTERHTRRLEPASYLDTIEDLVTDLHLLLWRARWEMCIGGGERILLAEEADPMEPATAEGGAS